MRMMTKLMTRMIFIAGAAGLSGCIGSGDPLDLLPPSERAYLFNTHAQHHQAVRQEPRTQMPEAAVVRRRPIGTVALPGVAARLNGAQLTRLKRLKRKIDRLRPDAVAFAFAPVPGREGLQTHRQVKALAQRLELPRDAVLIQVSQDAPVEAITVTALYEQ